jgi:MoaA/NifB/PqqE/SkfB family radical SAM enzyme
VGVLVANIEGRVLVSYQRGLLDEVCHGILVTLGADIQACFVCGSGRVRPCPFFSVSLGVVDDPW